MDIGKAVNQRIDGISDAIKGMTDQEISLAASARLEKALNDIQELSDAKKSWVTEVTDEYGDHEIDDEDWFDGLDGYNDSIAEAGLRLADAVRLYMQEA